MDDFVISNLHESRNEWCNRLVSILTPLITEGIRSIFNESWKLCSANDELNKYLMTFQNLLSRIPKWNNNIIEEEKNRIIERSNCNYLEDLISCVHIIQLKILTCIRVGNKQKKIDISTPKLSDFIHKVYINTARKVYSNIYLFEKNISPLSIQKNNRELELIIQDSILISIRESIPTESIIRAYMDESVEEEEEVIIEDIVNDEEPVIEDLVPIKSENNAVENKETIPDIVPSISDINDDKVVTSLSFNDIDSVIDENNEINSINAPKTIERLEEISTTNALHRLNDDDDDDYDDKIKIHSDDVNLTDFDILNNHPEHYTDNDIVLNDVEVLG